MLLDHTLYTYNIMILYMTGTRAGQLDMEFKKSHGESIY